MAEYAACSTTVADAGRDNPAPIEELVIDLAKRTHETGLEHYRPLVEVDPSRCSYRAFAAERDERLAFESFIAEIKMPGDDRITKLAAWDRAERAVAIVHWFHVVRAA